MAALGPFATALDLNPAAPLPLADLKVRVADMLEPLARSFDLGGRPAVKALARWAECTGVDGGFQLGKWFGAHAAPAQAPPGGHASALDLAQFKGMVQAACQEVGAASTVQPFAVGARGGGGGSASARSVPGSAGSVAGPGSPGSEGMVLGASGPFILSGGIRYLRLPGQNSSFDADLPATAGSKDARAAVSAAVSSNPALLLRRLGRPWDTEAVQCSGFSNAFVELAAMYGLASPSLLTTLAGGSLPLDLDVLLGDGGSRGLVVMDLANRLEFLVRFQESVFGSGEHWARGLRSLLPEWQARLGTWGVDTFKEAWSIFVTGSQSSIDAAIRSLLLSMSPADSQFDRPFFTAAWALTLPDLATAWGATAATVGTRVVSGGASGVRAGSSTARKRGRVEDDITKGVCYLFAGDASACSGGCGFSHDPQAVQAYLRGRSHGRRTMSSAPGSAVRSGGASRGPGRGFGKFGPAAVGTMGSDTQGVRAGATGAQIGAAPVLGDVGGGVATPGAPRS
jgi:hypothetical protein